MTATVFSETVTVRPGELDVQNADAARRWDAWQARGRARDARVWRRIQVIAAVLTMGLAGSLAWVITRG